MEDLVSTEWLAKEREAGDLRIVDASKHLPDAGRDPRADYEAGHIPGALFMDLAGLVDPAAPIENTLPGAPAFAAAMQHLGIGDGSRIVLYDDSAIRSATRAWFMLKLFGASNVAILDGGLAKWKGEGRPLATGPFPAEAEPPRPRHFTTWQDSRRLRIKQDMLDTIASHAEQVVDARGAARFAGTTPEPRAGLAAGHIPGALNLPYSAFYRPDGTFLSKPEIRATFEAAGIDLERPIVTSCGSGMTACVVTFAAHLIGKHDVALYDGSWAEWGADPATPKEKLAEKASAA